MYSNVAKLILNRIQKIMYVIFYALIYHYFTPPNFR